MNTGVISSRYARALLLFAQQTGAEEAVYNDALSLYAALRGEKDMKTCVENLCGQMQRFLSLVVTNGRKDFLLFILESFLLKYRDAKHIKVARLTTAVKSDSFEGKLKSKLPGNFEYRFEHDVDPDILGGFILQIDDQRLDASVQGELEQIQKYLEQENSRLR